MTVSENRVHLFRSRAPLRNRHGDTWCDGFENDGAADPRLRPATRVRHGAVRCAVPPSLRLAVDRVDGRGADLFDSLHIDLTPIFLFWAAAGLKRHSRTARRWVLGVGGLAFAVISLSILWTVLVGPSGTGTYGRRRIEDPTVWQVLTIAVPCWIIVAVPLLVLASGRARRQFGSVESV